MPTLVRIVDKDIQKFPYFVTRLSRMPEGATAKDRVRVASPLAMLLDVTGALQIRDYGLS